MRCATRLYGAGHSLAQIEHSVGQHADADYLAAVFIAWSTFVKRLGDHSLAPPGPRVGQQAGSLCLAAIFTAWNALRFHKPPPTRAADLLERCTGVGKKIGLSLLARATFNHRRIADRTAYDYGRGAPPKLYDDFIYHAELIVSRAYFFSRWCVIAGIAIDKPIRTRGKRGKKNKGRR